MLIGHSLGGLFVLNTLTMHSDLFDKYVAIDPSLWWNDQQSLKEYEEVLRQQKFNGKSLFISIANTISRMDTTHALLDTTDHTEHFRSIVHFAKSLKQTITHELDWRAKYYPDESHGSVALISEYDAFNFLFRKIPISMDLASLKQFEGKFSHQFEKGKDSFIEIKAIENHLQLTELWSGNVITFKPLSDTEFYGFDDHFPLAFKMDKKGVVEKVVAFNADVWDKVN
jgi:hypothetical protein